MTGEWGDGDSGHREQRTRAAVEPSGLVWLEGVQPLPGAIITLLPSWVSAQPSHIQGPSTTGDHISLDLDP